MVLQASCGESLCYYKAKIRIFHKSSVIFEYTFLQYTGHVNCSINSTEN